MGTTQSKHAPHLEAELHELSARIGRPVIASRRQYQTSGWHTFDGIRRQRVFDGWLLELPNSGELAFVADPQHRWDTSARD